MLTCLLGNIFMMLNVENLGQVFTPQHIVSDMLNLIRNTSKLQNARFLEPSCGNGAFLNIYQKIKLA